MSSMSRNDSTNSLMGFSVLQPAIGASLQFFPAMGSKQLDEMINAYIPGDVSILDKRAAVSMEFFEYSMATGDLFKFFMVYPTLGSANTSPTMDSGCHSGFTTSPVMSEAQWAGTSSRTVSPSSSRKATSANDFSNLPGMKIMTKDGQDVTNSASRGCKTKEQRDHAHLMRIIKACDSCRRKKTKCDPSHKRPAAGASGKVTKKTSKNPRPAAAPPQIAAKHALTTIEFDQLLSESSSSLDSFFTDSLNVPVDGFSMEWDQFIQYDEESSEVIPYDYNFLLDPAGYFSPATTASFSSSSTSPSQLPITPIDRDVHITNDTAVGHDHKPILPYLHPGLLEAGDNYVDFNLYSPQSSFLDEELGFAKEVAASPIQSQPLDHRRRRRLGAPEEDAGNGAGFQFARSPLDSEPTDSYQRDAIINIGDGLLHDTSNYMHEWSGGNMPSQTTSQVVSSSHRHAIPSSDGQAMTSHALVNVAPAGLSIVDNVLEGVTSEGLYGRETIYEHTSSRPLSDRGRLRSQSSLIWNSAADATGLHERQALLQGSLDCHSADTGAQSSSPQPYLDRSCGQDGLNKVEHTVTSSMTTSALATQTTESQLMRSTQGDAFGDVHNIRSTKVPHVETHRVPNPDTPSPSPSSSPSPSRCPLGVTIPDSLNAGSLPSDTFSWEALETDKHTIEHPVAVVSGDFRAEQNHAAVRTEVRAEVRTWSSGSVSLHSTSVIQSLATARSQSILSDTMPAASVIAGLGVLSVVRSLSTIAKSNNHAQDVQPIASSDLSRCITALLLFSLSLSMPSSLIAIFSISVLSIVGGYVQLQRYMSAPDTNTQSSDSPASHKLAFTKKLFNSTNNIKATYAKVTGLV
ncbi:hypothetical protein F4782DRAFT_370995 [Xylaria castorea]|nr:hypothetical protein F4782DRAFT_370995 [Xylaria castorea]